MRAIVILLTVLTGASVHAHVHGGHHQVEQDSCPEVAALGGQVVRFEIKEGTVGAWNTIEEIVHLKVGDALCIINNNTRVHRLHTNGAPCGHGPEIQPGQSWTCQINRAYDPAAQGHLYDHIDGSSSPFWIIAHP